MPAAWRRQAAELDGQPPAGEQPDEAAEVVRQPADAQPPAAERPDAEAAWTAAAHRAAADWRSPAAAQADAPAAGPLRVPAEAAGPRPGPAAWMAEDDWRSRADGLGADWKTVARRRPEPVCPVQPRWVAQRRAP